MRVGKKSSHKTKWRGIRERERETNPAGDDDTSNDGYQGSIGEPRLSFEGHEVGEDGSEEGRGGSNSLIEGDRKEAQTDVATHNGCTEDNAEHRDLEELHTGANALHRDHLEPRDPDIAQHCACWHVAHSEEDWVLESIVGEKILVEQEDPYVGEIPRANQA